MQFLIISVNCNKNYNIVKTILEIIKKKYPEKNLITRGHYSTFITFLHVEFAYFYENYTNSSGKGAIFIRRRMNGWGGGNIIRQKMTLFHYSTGIITLIYTGLLNFVLQASWEIRFFYDKSVIFEQKLKTFT